MTISVRKLLAVALLGASLAGCGSDPASAPPKSADKSAPSAPGAVGAAAPVAQGAPTLAPGPGGLTPVFERAPVTARGEKVVALTFDADMTADQGPRAAGGEHFDNPALIADLRRLKVPATVFMTGRWAEEYPAEARAIGTDPAFEIGNHSYSHYAFKSDCYGLSVVGQGQARADVEKATAQFKKAGVRNAVPYFRFPGGCYNDEVLRELAPLKMTAVQWDVVSGDAFATNADAVAEQVLAGVKPGSLVVMHCTRSAAPVTDTALQRIVPELRKRGYRFVKVSDLIRGATAHH
ncbi:polysaccharide deacetylase family protein [Streptomyces sp. NBC_00083]|uniref:polysaccharide deacetylase family protein n=1 Tax=Streptomyces sp. NBC_00083 TaxID=2975647 RepID=UPI0022513210|nr:polysaccharide deacetylase family protein [Streptomyces sp. NBC_00083]MCX5386320.1 polysaccharide deacetylase family protein [Streptomyces sp. NBC_00083]